MQFHQVDGRWSTFGCHDFESYLERYLVKGNFHEKVPQEILKDYTTVEYLIAHAYYYFPMYDEAIIKLVRTFELAIKLCCKELNIDFHYANKKGKMVEKKLNRLIEDLVKVKGESLKDPLNRANALRNMIIHPTQHAFIGGMSQPAIIGVLKTINEIFAD